MRSACFRYQCIPWFANFLLLTVASPCWGEDFELRLDDLPAASYLDRWMYPFNVTPGSRIQAPTFGALGSEGFDDRDGQYVVALDTAALGIEAGLPASQYRITSATLTLTETFGGYRYDPTFDPFTTYLDEEAPLFTDDADDGRPIELYGTGFRGGFTDFAFPDNQSTDAPLFSAGSEFGGDGKRVRNAFAADALGADVSNSVDSVGGGESGFDPIPFAVARLVKDDEEIEPGEFTTAGAQWIFDVNLEDANIHAYFARSFAAGQLGLAVTSMHTTGVQGAGDPFPNPATVNHFAFDGPVLSISLEIVPGKTGDFDGDGVLTAHDIDALSLAVRNGSGDLQFDLTGDSVIDAMDRLEWVAFAGTLLGDADLNQQVAFADFLSLSTNFGRESGWSSGDFDGNGEVGFPDFLSLSQNFGVSANPMEMVGVPEPSGVTLVLFLGMVLLIPRYRNRVR